MRAPGRRRPARRTAQTLIDSATRADLARRARLTAAEPLSGDRLSPVNNPALLTQALAFGQVGAPFEDGFPRYVWHRLNDEVTEFRLTGTDAGEYRAYRLTPSYWPEGLQ